MFCFMFPGMQKVGVQSVPVPSILWRRPLLGPNCGLPDSLVQMTTVSTPETPSPCGPISLAGPGPTGTLRRLCNEVNFFLRYHIRTTKRLLSCFVDTASLLLPASMYTRHGPIVHQLRGSSH